MTGIEAPGGQQEAACPSSCSALDKSSGAHGGPKSEPSKLRRTSSAIDIDNLHAVWGTRPRRLKLSGHAPPRRKHDNTRNVAAVQGRTSVRASAEEGSEAVLLEAAGGAYRRRGTPTTRPPGRACGTGSRGIARTRACLARGACRTAQRRRVGRSARSGSCALRGHVRDGRAWPRRHQRRGHRRIGGFPSLGAA